jgi:PAS domain S-box-containing protein
VENELTSIVDALPDVVLTARPDGNVDFLSHRWYEYTGIGDDNAFGQGWQAAIHPVDLSQLLDRWRAVLASGERGDMQARIRRLDGEYRQFLFRIRPIFEPSGQVVKWCGMTTDIEDQQRAAEEALRLGESRFRTIADSIPAQMAVMTPTGEVESANRQFLDYIGATLEELKGWAPGDTVHPDDSPLEIAAWKRSVATGEPYDIEMRTRRTDDVYRWVHVRGLPVKHDDGRVTGWYILQTDIDDRKRAQAQLAGEKRLLEMVASGYSLPDTFNALCSFVEDTAADCSCGVYLIDWSGPTFHYAAAPTVPATFYAPMDGAVLRDEIGPCAIAARLKTQVIAADIESDVQWKDSAFRTLALANGFKSCWSTPIYTLAGTVLGTFAIYQRTPASPTPLQLDLIAQVTHIASIAIERTQGEAALRRSEAFLAQAQRLSSTGSFLWRIATDEITFSEQSKRIFEFDQVERVTLDLIGSRVHPEDIPMLSETIALARSDRRDLDYEIRLRMPDHSIKYLHTIAEGTRGQDGQLEYFGAIQDVTERRLSEEALANVRSELTRVARVTSLGALTASIAHEVNQPLSGIITNASTCLRMLGADPPNIDGARETARRTIRDGNRASEVITRLRALFSNKRNAAESVDLNEATREVIALLRSELQSSRVILRVELADDLPPLTADRIQLQQVVLNLLLNAADAMSGVEDRSRRLVVRTERDGDHDVRLTVQDAGVGLDPHSLDKLFDAFYTTKAGGMGIGLSVSRSIIERHHGRLWAMPNDGPGATFAFSIPQLSEDVTGARSPDDLSSAAGMGRAQVGVST